VKADAFVTSAVRPLCR